MAGWNNWQINAAVIEGLAFLAWLVTLRTGQLRCMFIVGFNAILPVAWVHLFYESAFHWRNGLAMAMAVIYVARLNWVVVAWTKFTAIPKLDRELSAAEKHALPFVMTNAAGWLYCLPFYFTAQRTAPFNGVDALAVVVYLAGSTLHTAADLQKKRFKQRPGTPGRIFDEGLWGWSRHPNYFGDFLVYVSWAILAANPWAWVSPATNILQYFADAIPKNELWASQRYGDAWAEYARRTSRFLPLPPKRT